ncbi:MULTISPECIES: ABC transporter ATP-binding protein [Lactobacillus]|uniref:ABC transporter ATP-binding protein n=1 Tax=Lactobacillus xujianguonis TaxID=2495899 RepID=A0A437ST57_9LACO|nr:MULTISPECIES: ABC transporter ATP-binding protein [Lactobacillus]RVU70044.1 ABC transporter ATP-binding protein [Lactobacillus xujianguonis]RVU72403.1 ABC transporter ATP-binding protein [Lactobacillus xujianguonis]
MKSQRINFRWILKHIPVYLQLIFLVLSAISAFEGVLNAVLFGQLTNVNYSNVDHIYQFIGLAFAAYLIVYTSMLLFYLVQNKIVMLLNVALKEEYFSSKFANSKKTSSSDAINSIVGTAKEIEQKYFYGITDVIQFIFNVVASAVVVVETNIVLGIIYLILSALTLIPSYIGKKRMANKTELWNHSNSQLVQVMKDIFEGRLEIINFGVRHLFFKHFDHVLFEEEDKYRQMNNCQFYVQFIAWLISLVTLLLPIFIGLVFMQKGLFNVTVAAIITLSLSADRVVGYLRTIALYQTQMHSTDTIREVNGYHFDEKASESAATNHPVLQIKNLSFAYNNKKILDKLNLTLHDQEKIIITGASGIGKSTLLNCVANNLKYDGQITFNDQPIASNDFIKISQKVWLFQGTVRENLNLLQNISDEKMLKEAEKVGLVKELGNNLLDKKISSDASNLSGGQAQRLALVRGLIRSKKIYLLDEVCSNLDQKNSDAIHQIIYQLPATVIEIAHNYNPELARENNVQVYKLVNGKLEKEA